MTTQTLQHDAWIPRAEAAAIAGCSPDSIRRDVEKHKLDKGEDDQGRILVNVGDLIRIGRIRPEALSSGMTATESAEVIRARETVTALREQVAENTGRLTHADTLVQTLKEQLTQKDRQIAKQAEQLTALIARLGTIGGAA